MKDKYIAIIDGSAWTNVQESQGWIFRRLDNQRFGFDGHHPTLRDAIHSIANYGAVVVNHKNEIVARNRMVWANKFTHYKYGQYGN